MSIKIDDLEEALADGSSYACDAFSNWTSDNPNQIFEGREIIAFMTGVISMAVLVYEEISGPLTKKERIALIDVVTKITAKERGQPDYKPLLSVAFKAH